MQMTFLVLSYPKDMHIEFLCISEVAAGKNDMLSFQIKASPLHIGLKYALVGERIGGWYSILKARDNILE